MHKANSRNAQGKLYTKVGRVVFRLGAGRSVGGVGRADMAAVARGCGRGGGCRHGRGRTSSRGALFVWGLGGTGPVGRGAKGVQGEEVGGQEAWLRVETGCALSV